jgi:hypothetical protein
MPSVVFSYWLLKLILTIGFQYKVYENHTNLLSRQNRKAAGDEAQWEEDEEELGSSTILNKKSSFHKVTSPEGLSKLLKVSSATHNDSLQFLLFDISSCILQIINFTLQLSLMRDLSCQQRLEKQKEIEKEEKERKSALSSSPSAFLSPISPSFAAPLPSSLLQLTAGEYYISIAKERYLLSSLSSRLKVEFSASKLLLTRYTRSLINFLSQWYYLRKQLNLSSFSYLHEYKLYHLSPYSPYSHPPYSFRGSVGRYLPSLSHPYYQHLYETNNEKKDRQHGNEDNRVSSETHHNLNERYLKIIQISSTSVSIAWSLAKITTELSSYLAKEERKQAKRRRRQLLRDSGVVVDDDDEDDGNDGDDEEHDEQEEEEYERRLLELSNDIYGYNLYITGLSYLGMETPLLVLSNVDYKGTFRIDDLEPDTLYKITIKKDSSQEKKKRRKILKKRQRLLEERKQQRGTARRGAVIDDDDDCDEEDDEEEEEESDDEDDDQDDSEEEEDDNEDVEESQEESQQGPSPTKSKTKTLSSSSSVNSSMNVIVATDNETTFGFSSDSLSPNIMVVSTSPLTLKNFANKKWSTARANIRLSSGIHRWDVHVDRCVSKNIFLGVTTREARLDNYVGCDVYGWAFLANKAVWHGKSKLKTYGELFRTGDTVTVILDLDNGGTLSFCINDRPLGVAIEGLVGPLYPAFSLYNEDDQLTITQVRSCSSNGSIFSNSDARGGENPSTSSPRGGGAGGNGTGGSFIAENILDRMEFLRSILQYLSFSNHHVLDHYEQSREKDTGSIILPASSSDVVASSSLLSSSVEEKERKEKEKKEHQKEEEELERHEREQEEREDDNQDRRNLNDSLRSASIKLQDEMKILQKSSSSSPPSPSERKLNSVEEESKKGNSSNQKEPRTEAGSTIHGKEKDETMEEKEDDEDNYQTKRKYSSSFTLFSSDILQELYLRLLNWMEAINIRTLFYNNCLYSLQTSAALIFDFTEGKALLDERLIVEKKAARIIGIGNYRLFLRCDIDNEIITLTYDTFHTMLEKKLIEISTTGTVSELLDTEGGGDGSKKKETIKKEEPLSLSSDKSPSSPIPPSRGLFDNHHNLTGLPYYRTISSISSTAEMASNQALNNTIISLKKLSLSDFKSLLLDKMNDWRVEYDHCLHYLLSFFLRINRDIDKNVSGRERRRRRSDNFNHHEINFHDFYLFLFSFSQEILGSSASFSSLDSIPVKLFPFFSQLFLSHSLEAIMIRTLLFHISNDLFLSLSSFLLPYSQATGHCSAESIFSLPPPDSSNSQALSSTCSQYSIMVQDLPYNHPSFFLKEYRCFIYPSIKEQMILSMFYSFSMKMKEIMKSFYSFYSSLSYTSLIEATSSSSASSSSSSNERDSSPLIAGELSPKKKGEEQQRMIPSDKMMKRIPSIKDPHNVTANNSPLTIISSSSPTRDMMSGLASSSLPFRQQSNSNSNLLLPPSATFASAAMISAVDNGKIPSPTTLYSSTMPTTYFLQRQNTNNSINSLGSALMNQGDGSEGEKDSKGEEGGRGRVISELDEDGLGDPQQLQQSLFHVGGKGDDQTDHQQLLSSLLHLPLMKENQFIFYLEDSTTFYSYYSQNILKGKGTSFSSSFSSVDKDNRNENSWSLVAWIQTSYVGQWLHYCQLLQTKYSNELIMSYSPSSMKYFQNIFSLFHNQSNSGSNSNSTIPPHPPGHGKNQHKETTTNNAGGNVNNILNMNWKDRKDLHLWEYCFRYHYGNYVSSSSTSSDSPDLASSSQQQQPPKKILPLLIRCLSKPSISSFSAVSSTTFTSALLWKERLSIYLFIFENQQKKLSNSKLSSSVAVSSPFMISETTIFSIFLQESCDQIQELFDCLYFSSSSTSSEISLKELISCEKLLLSSLSSAEVSLLLQVFHGIGTLIGLGIRNGFYPMLSFPSIIYSILANEEIIESSSFFPSLLSFLSPSSSSLSSSMTHSEEQKNGKKKKEDHKEEAIGMIAKEYQNYQKESKSLSSLKILHSIALAIRFGISSIYPEV